MSLKDAKCAVLWGLGFADYILLLELVDLIREIYLILRAVDGCGTPNSGEHRHDRLNSAVKVDQGLHLVDCVIGAILCICKKVPPFLEPLLN